MILELMKRFSELETGFERRFLGAIWKLHLNAILRLKNGVMTRRFQGVKKWGVFWVKSGAKLKSAFKCKIAFGCKNCV